MKSILKRIGLAFVAVLVIVAIYVAYVFMSYYRVEDYQVLAVENPVKTVAKVQTEYKITSANIGFGAYSDTYSFFMDGGKYSRAFSKEAVLENVQGEISIIQKENANFHLFQEVDIDGTRSYHVNQYNVLKKGFKQTSVFAQNYDSPYLMYPFTSPHGKNKAGIVTFSDFQITSSIRRSLPIETGVTKLLDLDRCYSKSRIPVENGKELVLYNVHLSAYTTDSSTATNQLKMLFKDMQKEYKKGNYIVGGGDFNKDLLGDSYSIFKQGEEMDRSWAKPLPKELIPDHLNLVVPYDASNPIPSCRDADMPYSEDNFVITVDGFVTSDNVEVNASNVIDAQFKYSDHNPVYMTFVLK